MLPIRSIGTLNEFLVLSSIVHANLLDRLSSLFELLPLNTSRFNHIGLGVIELGDDHSSGLIHHHPPGVLVHLAAFLVTNCRSVTIDTFIGHSCRFMLAMSYIGAISLSHGTTFTGSQWASFKLPTQMFGSSASLFLTHVSQLGMCLLDRHLSHFLHHSGLHVAAQECTRRSIYHNIKLQCGFLVRRSQS